MTPERPTMPPDEGGPDRSVEYHQTGGPPLRCGGCGMATLSLKDGLCWQCRPTPAPRQLTVNEFLSGLMDAADAAIAGREHEPLTMADVGVIYLALQSRAAKLAGR